MLHEVTATVSVVLYEVKRCLFSVNNICWCLSFDWTVVTQRTKPLSRLFSVKQVYCLRNAQALQSTWVLKGQRELLSDGADAGPRLQTNVIRALPGKKSSDRIKSIKQLHEGEQQKPFTNSRSDWQAPGGCISCPSRSEGQRRNNNRSSCNPTPELLLSWAPHICICQRNICICHKLHICICHKLHILWQGTMMKTEIRFLWQYDFFNIVTL